MRALSNTSKNRSLTARRASDATSHRGLRPEESPMGRPMNRAEFVEALLMVLGALASIIALVLMLAGV